MQLGDLLRDKVTGFEGIAHAKTTWLNGCIRWTIQPQGLDKDGKPREGATFDQHQLEVITASKVPAHESVAPVVERYTGTGGERTDPVQRQDPTR